MKFGVLGTGIVGQTLASKLVALGHEVAMGSRTANNEKARQWAAKAGPKGRAGTFKDAAKFGQIVLNCTEGMVSLEALRTVDRKDLAGKVLIDVANPLDGSKGGVPVLSVCNADSLGESIQREFPEARVVKALNTCNCNVMVEPGRVKGDHDLFLCGNDPKAKEQVAALLRDFGWKSVIDLGDISNARGTEQLLPLWMRLYGLFRSPDFNFKIVRG
jgi:8-hydroxy-5-deazaflavin:NADPH oxidoreductase